MSVILNLYSIIYFLILNQKSIAPIVILYTRCPHNSMRKAILAILLFYLA